MTRNKVGGAVGAALVVLGLGVMASPAGADTVGDLDKQTEETRCKVYGQVITAQSVIGDSPDFEMFSRQFLRCPQVVPGG